MITHATNAAGMKFTLDINVRRHLNRIDFFVLFIQWAQITYSCSYQFFSFSWVLDHSKMVGLAGHPFKDQISRILSYLQPKYLPYCVYIYFQSGTPWRCGSHGDALYGSLTSSMQNVKLTSPPEIEEADINVSIF